MKAEGGVVKDDERSEERNGARANAHHRWPIEALGPEHACPPAVRPPDTPRTRRRTPELTLRTTTGSTAPADRLLSSRGSGHEVGRESRSSFP
jgi:hypothetical protein